MATLQKGTYAAASDGELYHYDIPQCCREWIRVKQGFNYCPICGSYILNKVIFEEDVEY